MARTNQRDYTDLPGPRGLPFIGCALSVRPGIFHLQLERWAARYGPIYRVRIGPSRLLVLSGHERISAVLQDRPEGFSRVQRMRRVAIEMGLKEGVFSADGDLWRSQRGMVTAAFNPANVKRWTPSLVQVVNKLHQRWVLAAESCTPVDLQADLMRYTVDVVAGLALGAPVDTLSGGEDVLQNDLDAIFPALFQRAMAPLPVWRWFRTERDRRLAASMERVNQTVDELVVAAKKRLSDDDTRRTKPPNLLEAMIVASEQGAENITDDIIAGNVMTMLLAGEDTTANTLAWTIHLLSANPQVLVQARNEVDDVLAAGTQLDIEKLERLTFLDACAREALRIHPVAPILPVEAVADTVVENIAIDAGTVVVNLMRTDANDPELVVDAHRFKPQRWLNTEPQIAFPKRLSMPFGGGPRLCPGRFLALLEIKVVLAMLLSRFEIVSVDTPDGREPREHLSFTMAPVGLTMKLEQRVR